MPRPELPNARGPLSEAVISALRAPESKPNRFPEVGTVDLLADDDAQLALACCYELHYHSFAGVDDRLEWDPDLLRFRGDIESAFVRRLQDEVGRPTAVSPEDVIPSLLTLAHTSGGPSLSSFMAREGQFEHMREFCAHRSAYQRKEADPHTWMIPRLQGRAKAAAVAIQYDEYGGGTSAAMHSELFQSTMRALDLDPTYGAYLDALPATTLATDNLVSLFGLHRAWTSACVGHLALFEMTSVQPMQRYSSALQRLGCRADARRFYDVHVSADAWHEQIAQRELVAGLLELDPDAGGAILFGARALMYVEEQMTRALLDAWSRRTTALRAPLPRCRLAS
jgi:hypothetical protein